MGAEAISLDTLVQVRRAVSHVVTPRVAVVPRIQNPLWPVLRVPLLRGQQIHATLPAPSVAMPIGSAAAVPAGSMKRDTSRAIGVDADQTHGVVINLRPMARRSATQQQAAVDAAAALLADALPAAQTAAPGVVVSVALRGRVLASSDPSRVVSPLPGGPLVKPSHQGAAKGSAQGAPVLAAPAVAAPASPIL